MPEGRRRGFKRLNDVEREIYDRDGREALVEWWRQRRDEYNARRREERDARRRRILEIWEERPTLGTQRLAEILGVSWRTVWRDRAALREQGHVSVRSRVREMAKR